MGLSNDDIKYIESELSLTTIKYSEWKSRGFTPGHWKNAFDRLNSGLVLVPPPVIPPSTILFPYKIGWEENFESGTLGSELLPTNDVNAIIDVVSNPLGSGRVLRLATPLGTGGPNSRSAMAAVYANQLDPTTYANTYASENVECIYSMDIILPSDYVPSVGNWNWFFENHISDGVPQNQSQYPGGGGVSCGLGIVTDYKAAPNNPRWWVRLAGGDYANRTEDSTEAHGTSVPIKLGLTHMDFNVKWNRTTGKAYWGWYVDKVLKWESTSTNMFSKTDGTPDWMGFGLYNYHVVPAGSVLGTQDWPITVYFDNVVAGRLN